MSPLHAAIIGAIGNRPALVISEDALRGMILSNFRDAVAKMTAVSVPIEGYPSVALRLVGLSSPVDQFTVHLEAAAPPISTAKIGVVAKIDPGFTAEFALHSTSDAALEFSRIFLTVGNLASTITARAPLLNLGTVDFDVQGEVVKAASRPDALAAGVGEIDVQRIEGALAYVMPHRLVASAYATISSINLAELYPALQISGVWEVELVQGTLLVVPTDGIDIVGKGCACAGDPAELKIVIDPPDHQEETTYDWSGTAQGIPPFQLSNADPNASGFVALYAPKPMLEQRFDDVQPAFTYHESDNGFLGYDLTILLRFTYVALRVDQTRFGLVIDFNVISDGSAFANVDVPCVGRSDVGYARFTSEPTKLSLFVGLAKGPSGELDFTCQIDTLDIGDFHATVDVFGRWLAAAGGQAAVVGFLLDKIAGRAIEARLPGVMADGIRSAVGSRSFRLMALKPLLTYVPSYGFNTITYSGDGATNSMLVGLTSRG